MKMQWRLLRERSKADNSDGYVVIKKISKIQKDCKIKKDFFFLNFPFCSSCLCGLSPKARVIVTTY